MNATPGAAVLDGIAQVEHFVEKHVLHREGRNIGRIQAAAEDDGVVGWVKMS